MTVWNSAARWIDSILPARSRTDPTLRFNAELVFGFGAFEFVATILFCVSELAWGSNALGAIYALALPPIFAILVWVRRGGDAARASIALMAVLFALVTTTNFSTGGRAIGANIAMPTVVLFAVLMSSPRAGLAWTGLIVAEIVVVAFLRRSRYEFPIRPNPEWVKSAIDRVPLFFSLASALIAVVTRRALQRFQAHLEGAHKVAAANAARFSDFAEIAADGFWETDADMRLTYVSPSFAQAMGLDAARMLGLTPEQAYRLRFPDLPDLSAYTEPMRNKQPFDHQLLQMVNQAGYKRVLLNQGLPIYADNGEFIGFRGVVQDVTAQRRAEKALRDSEQKLRVMAEFDTLTGLPNRNLFNARLVEAIAHSQDTGKAMALAFLDLDRFKSINDRLGHKAGDQALQEFARRLSECVRQTDTVARLAGDEFVIVLEDLERPEEAATVAKKILGAMAAAFELSGQPVAMSTSIGIALRHAGELDGGALLRRADEALYAAKAAGRATYRLAE